MGPGAGEKTASLGESQMHFPNDKEAKLVNQGTLADGVLVENLAASYENWSDDFRQETV